MASHRLPLFFMAMIIITKQKRLTITVKAFFSDKYFFITADLRICWIFYILTNLRVLALASAF
jgi:hypothetical protein